LIIKWRCLFNHQLMRTAGSICSLQNSPLIIHTLFVGSDMKKVPVCLKWMYCLISVYMCCLLGMRNILMKRNHSTQNKKAEKKPFFYYSFIPYPISPPKVYHFHCHRLRKNDNRGAFCVHFFLIHLLQELVALLIVIYHLLQELVALLIIVIYPLLCGAWMCHCFRTCCVIDFLCVRTRNFIILLSRGTVLFLYSLTVKTSKLLWLTHRRKSDTYSLSKSIV